ncbi:MAG TPA: hypothetical protein VKT77_11400, partial [Chthonomonadaceae bacterium]|nr:hypothetical protein [Chthonomonadaceae bacterium]
MESRSEHAQPEQQAWKPTAYTPQAPGRMAHAESALGVGAVTSSVVCAQVRAQLDLLVENDGSLRPEAATALQVHMAVCTDCAREFREMQRIVNILEAMPLADLPRDFAPLVARRIQAAGLCDRVREKLQPLMDGDPGIGSEMTAALYGHLAVCRQCADEFARLRSMVNLLETLPPAELPIDYSRPIMRRIQESGLAPGLKEQNAVGPTFAASSSVSGEVAIH